MIRSRALPACGSSRAALLLIMFAVTSLTGCSEPEIVQPKSMDDALAQDFAQVGAARVYFGHRSVGRDILAGLADLQGQLQQPAIHVAELGSLEVETGRSVLLHTAIGQNRHPDTKCEDFRQVMRQLQGRVDVALFKFCYVDFDDRSDASAIFETYARTMDELRRQYPDVVFVHVTSPLRTLDRSARDWMRDLFEMRNRAKHANAVRGEFNRLLRERYASEPIFDLAAVTSTYPDGRRETFELGGKTYESLVPAYTDDGGHLDAVGATYGAAAFVKSVAAALRSKGGAGDLQSDQ